MGFLSRFFGQAESPKAPGPLDDFWYTDIGAQSSAGVRVTPDSALRVAAVYACVSLLASTIASLPLGVFRPIPRGKEKVPGHPLWDVLGSTPNNWQTAFEWKQMMQGHLALRGNAYSRILPGARGAVDQLLPLHPDRVDVYRLGNGRLGYEVCRPDSQIKDRYTQDEILHLRNFSLDGMKGLSPISLAREAIGGSLAANAFGGALFRNGAKPAGAIKVPAGTKYSSRAIENLRMSWHDRHGGPDNAGRPAILEEGLEWVDIGMTSEDAQWVEYLKMSRADIAMIFRIPPHMIGDVEKSTSWGAGIEAQGIGFVTYTLMAWLTLWEQACNRDFLPGGEFFTQFNVNKLLRGDRAARYAAHAIARQWGWASVNDIREEEEMPPIPGGDEYLQPLNMAPIGQTPEQGQQQDQTPPADQQAQDEPSDNQASARSGLIVLLKDAAERCAAAEVRGLEKRAGHAAADPERFTAWLADYYGQHEKYLVRTLQPVADAWLMQSRQCVDVARLAHTLTQSALHDLGGNPAAVVAEWAGSRATRLTAVFEEAFHGE
jgi:HK97 family phage portal protein